MHNPIGGLMALVVLIAPLVAFAVPPQPENSQSLQEVEALWVEERFPPRARVEELLDRALAGS